MRTNLDALFPKTRQAILSATFGEPDRWGYMPNWRALWTETIAEVIPEFSMESCQAPFAIDFDAQIVHIDAYENDAQY